MCNRVAAHLWEERQVVGAKEALLDEHVSDIMGGSEARLLLQHPQRVGWRRGAWLEQVVVDDIELHHRNTGREGG